MIYRITASADATIYERDQNIDRTKQNTGLDEILELRHDIHTGATFGSYNSRILIKFDLNSVSQSIWVDESASPNCSLKLYECQSSALPISYDIYIYPISQSWEMGAGKLSDDPINKQGVSWLYRDDEDNATEWLTSSWAAGSTGSEMGGCTWYTASADNTTYFQSYEHESADISMNISEYVTDIIENSRSNDGFIIKRIEADEQNSGSEFGNIQFFSTDTNTIYQPRLEIKWDNSTWSTGSLTELTAENIIVYLYMLRSKYKLNTKAKFRVIGQEKYPSKTFVEASSAITVKYLPTSSYYSVIDAHTDEVVIPFSDDYTKLSCDSTSNYFNLWMDQFEPNRFYKFIFKIVRSETEEYFDNKYMFKIVK